MPQADIMISDVRDTRMVNIQSMLTMKFIFVIIYEM